MMQSKDWKTNNRTCRENGALKCDKDSLLAVSGSSVHTLIADIGMAPFDWSKRVCGTTF